MKNRKNAKDAAHTPDASSADARAHEPAANSLVPITLSVAPSSAPATPDFDPAQPPRTPDELHAWLVEHLGLRVPLLPLLAAHSTPFDYLVHSFFEGRWARGVFLSSSPDSRASSPLEHSGTTSPEHLYRGASSPPGAACMVFQHDAADTQADQSLPSATAQTRSEGGGLEAPRYKAQGEHAPLRWLESAAPLDAIVWANRGGGKTFMGAVATLLDLVFKPGVEVRILGGSMDQSRRMHAHLRRLFDERSHPALAALLEKPISERRIVLKNGSELELLAQSQTSVRGTRVQKLRCDEVELFARDVWEAAQLVTRSKEVLFGGAPLLVRGSVECLSTMHVPHGIMHGVVREANAGTRTLFRWGVVDVLGSCGTAHACSRGEGEGIVRCPLWEECEGRAKARDAQGVPPGHVSVADAIGMKSRVSLKTWAAEMLCLHPRRSDAVLEEFDARLHVFGRDEDVPVGALVAGMDFGFRAPTVVVFAILAEDGTLWVVDERAEAERVLEEHIDAIKIGRGRRAVAWATPAWIGVDPAGSAKNGQSGRSDVQVMREHGLVVKARRAKVEDGLELVRARLRPAGGGAPRLFVHSRCTTLIESLEKYHYPPDDPRSVTPVKDGSDHAVDALRYLVQNTDRVHETAHGTYLEGP